MLFGGWDGVEFFGSFGFGVSGFVGVVGDVGECGLGVYGVDAGYFGADMGEGFEV